ncbi:MAG: methyltransferase domain-containing protein [Chloroflexi bacterium]|nr:methyltransferase domain-containing protein [Chloroflexota bacterium]
MTTQSHVPDLAAIKERQQQTWASGGYHKVAATIVIVSEQLCETVDLRAGQRVLDVATGNGNAALAAARRFCDVTGVDYVPALLEHGRQRAAAEALDVDFREGDAEALPFADASFDVVLSVFGTMFAPDQVRAARELLRVCRPGGKIGLVSHVPDSWLGEVFDINGRYLPSPAGLTSPFRWGTEAGLRELFGDQLASLTAARRTFTQRFGSADHYLAFFRTNYGPTLKAFEALDGARQEALAADLEELVLRSNRSGDATLVVPSDYLEVVATKR